MHLQPVNKKDCQTLKNTIKYGDVSWFYSVYTEFLSLKHIFFEPLTIFIILKRTTTTLLKYYTGIGKSTFTVVHMESNTIINK